MTKFQRSAVLLVGLLLLGSFSLWLGREISKPTWAQSFPDDLWEGELVNEVQLGENEQRVLGVDHYRFLEWFGAGPRVWLYLGYYAGQRSDAQVHAPEHCYPGTGWVIVRNRPQQVEGASLRELRIENQGNARMVWYGYRTRLGGPSSPYGLKRDQVLATLLGQPRDALLVRLSTPILEADGEDGARARLQQAWSEQARRVMHWFDEEGE